MDRFSIITDSRAEIVSTPKALRRKARSYALKKIPATIKLNGKKIGSIQQDCSHFQEWEWEFTHNGKEYSGKTW